MAIESNLAFVEPKNLGKYTARNGKPISSYASTIGRALDSLVRWLSSSRMDSSVDFLVESN